ncbi:MAG: phosphoribosyl transferase domain-containing protein [Parcubacteria group bacterium Gr01-1014_24]|nr:MAG: phosphoribosyl transferase domain-containing protein [Parcubacteria group bacterium Gr01-1014_24]
MFTDRKDAGSRLAEKLSQYRGKNAVILALPRGGVIIGYEIARALNLPLDIVVVRKIGHPTNPEYAICAVDERGSLLCNEEEVKSVDPDWLKEESLHQKNEALRRVTVYRGGRIPKEISRKTAILVDDGIATGLTIRAAIKSIRKENPEELVVAIPVAPHEVIIELRQEADAVIVLDDARDYLGAVGAYYYNFPQVSDQEVIELLKQ